jgi:hypothetical protein
MQLRKARTQPPKLPPGAGRLLQPEELRQNYLANPACTRSAIDEHQRLVKLPSLATAPSLAAATLEGLEAPTNERPMIGERLEDLVELSFELVQSLSIHAGLVVCSNHAAASLSAALRI